MDESFDLLRALEMTAEQMRAAYRGSADEPILIVLPYRPDLREEIMPEAERLTATGRYLFDWSAWPPRERPSVVNYVYADDGNVWDGDGYWTDLDRCREYAEALLAACGKAAEERRKAAAAIACADGHDWSEGANRWGPFDRSQKETHYVCQRDDCLELRIEPGWLPFEPKKHGGWVNSRTLEPIEMDCTGPGCRLCFDESLKLPGITRGGIQYPKQ